MKAMKILGGLIAAIAVLAFFSIFIVKEVNQAIVLQFGDPKRIILKPGLNFKICLLYTSPSPRDRTRSRMPSSA